MLLLKHDITRKKWLDNNNVAELDAGDYKGGEYKVETICESAIYARKFESV